MYRQQRITGWVLLGFLCLVVIGLWLSRWRFEGTQKRVNRFTGYTEVRIPKPGGGFEWVCEKEMGN
jgi:hypothetical protein